MAAVMSAKRPRALTNGIHSINGAGPHSRNKRPRRLSTDGSEMSPGDERSSVADDDDGPDNAAEDAHEQEQLVWATQRIQKDFQASTNKQNVATDCGIIEEIQCINFMCHEHLTVPLGPLINFIIGHNGSGKSAVLTALTICLGGKATATNRAQNLKSLIKEGKDHAAVTVRIKNQGPLAYKPNHYGDSIVVERHFSRSGTSGFKLKDRNNKIVSTKKAELEDILDDFSMQIDNPMNVLTQDMARQFLNHSTPKQKYDFFLKGTQLENLNRDYEQMHQSLDLMNVRVEVKKEDLAVLRNKMEELGKKARLAQGLERMRAKEKDIAHQLAWAYVMEEEKELTAALTGIREAELKIEQRTQETNQASERYERADQACDAARQNVTDITATIEPASQAAAEAKAKFDEIKNKLALLNADSRNAGADYLAKQKLVKKHETDIEQHRQRQAQADNGLYAVKVRELETAQKECEEARERYASHGNELPTLQEQLKAAQKESLAAEQKVATARDEEKRIRSTISTLQKGQQNWVEAYPNPPALDRLMRTIASENRFQEKPVGPIGRYVKLLRPEWGYILEKQLGAVPNAFVVTSKQDQNLLSQLMHKTGFVSAIYIGSRNYINTRSNEPDPSLLTFMRALKIEDDLIRNQLIINQTIEQIVLIEDPDEGLTFMHARGPLTKHVRSTLTFAAGDKRRGRAIAYTSNGGVNNSPIAEYRGRLRMQVDQEDQIRVEQARLQEAQRELQDLEIAASDRRGEVNSCKRREQDHNSQNKQLKLQSQRASEKVDRLDAELSDATPDAAAIEVLQEMLVTVKDEEERAKGIYTDVEVRKRELGDENRENKRDMESAQQAVKEIEFKLAKAQATVRKLQGQREEALRLKNDFMSRVAKAQENKSVWETERIRAQGEVDTAMESAIRVCAERVHVPDDATSDGLSEKLAANEAIRKATERELGGSQDELLRQANEAKRRHKDAMQEFEDITSLRSHLELTLKNRRTRWISFRSGISIRARVTFNYLLSERKFRGTLVIDHEQKSLDISVQPDINEQSGDGRQTKTLSGGEKSYSTVCLLLSLWDAMGSPIRCLDEFDVFMDSVNRERSMHMIIQAAQRSIGRQFIFITPQSMSNVNQTSDVKIIKMSDPERGQTALNVGRG